MGAPKSKTSKMKRRRRRAGVLNRGKTIQLKNCPECDSQVPSHIVCPSCGYYRERQVLSIGSF